MLNLDFSLKRVVNVVSAIILFFAIYLSVDYKNMVNMGIDGYEKCINQKVAYKLCNSLWMDSLADITHILRYSWLLGLGLPTVFYSVNFLLYPKQKVKKVIHKKGK